MSRRERPERISCVVIGCGRTIASAKLPAEHDQSICARHWSLVDKRLKLHLRTLRRIGARRGWTTARQFLEWRLWNRAKRQATERAMGISA